MYTPTYILYVATPTGWTYKTYTTTSNPAILKNQQIYKQYLIKRASEIAKIAGLAGAYLENTDKDRVFRTSPDERSAIKTGNTGPKIPKRPDDDEMWINVPNEVKKYLKMFKEGIKNRDPKKIVIGGGVVGGVITFVGLKIVGEHSEIITDIQEVLNGTYDTAKNSVYITGYA